MKKLILTFLSFLFLTNLSLLSQEVIKIYTSQGDIVIQLYPETVLHRENFLKLVESDFYDSVLFHRVIKDFMIQTGNPTTKPKKMKDAVVELNKIPAEINPKYIHKKGAIAAARQADDVNPKKESSSSQFYIVQGREYPRKYMPKFEESNGLKYTEEQMDIYENIGGTPHLDGGYTVFGEVLQGIEVVDRIAQSPIGRRDTPSSAVYVLKMEVLK